MDWLEWHEKWTDLMIQHGCFEDALWTKWLKLTNLERGLV